MSIRDLIDDVAASRERIRRCVEEIRKREYAELRSRDFDVYRRCVEAASTISLNHYPHDEAGKRTKLAADIEAALVSQALELLNR